MINTLKRKSKKKVKFIILFLFILFFGFLRGQNYHKNAYTPFWNIKGSGVTDAALAYNNTVSSGSISALSNNPAILGKTKNIITGISFNSNYFQQNAKMGNNYFGRENIKSNKISSGLDNTGIIYPVSVYKGKFVIGASFANRVQYNYHSEANGTEIQLYDDGTYTEYSLKETLDQKGNLNSYNFGAAIEFQKNLMFGGSIHIYNGDRYYRYEAEDEDIKDYYQYKLNTKDQYLDSKYYGYNISFGALYIGEYFEWGGKLVTPLNLDVKEDWESEITDIYDDGEEIEETALISNFEYKTKHPGYFSTGLAFKNNNIKLSLDGTFQNWDRIEYNIDNNQFSNQDSVETATQNQIKTKLGGTIDYGAGIQYFLKNLEVMAGFRRLNKPSKDISEKYDRLSLIGMGMKYDLTEKLTLGLGYQYSYGNNQGSPYFYTNKEEQYNNHRVVVSAQLSIPKR